MKVSEMNEYLEKRGFFTTRRYDTKSKAYVFTITKNGISVCDEFKYPVTSDWNHRNNCMMKFLTELIGKHNVFNFTSSSLATKEYCERDIESTKTLANRMSMTIKRVIFNPPATIVFWMDNTKTVVKCQDGDGEYDPEKGLAMAISKKALGNNHDYYTPIKKWVKKYYKSISPSTRDVEFTFTQTIPTNMFREFADDLKNSFFGTLTFKEKEDGEV